MKENNPLQMETNVQPDVEVSESQVKQDDILSRVSSFMTENAPKEPVEKDFHFDINDIDKIEDPNSREYVQKAHKSLEKAYQKKFQDLSEIRKTLESSLQNKRDWTPDEIKKMMETDQNFLYSLQQLAGLDKQAQDSEEYSALSEAERMKISNLEREIHALRNQAQIDIEKQQHEMLSQRYSDYDPQAIDSLKSDFIAGKVQATNEHLYKVLNYEKNVKAAYEMGRREALTGNVEKLQSSSLDGQSALGAPSPFKKQENEDSKSFWNRIAAQTLKSVNTKQNIRN